MFVLELYTRTLHTRFRNHNMFVLELYTRTRQSVAQRSAQSRSENPVDLHDPRPWKRLVKRGSFLTPPAAQGARRGAAVRLIQG